MSFVKNKANISLYIISHFILGIAILSNDPFYYVEKHDIFLLQYETFYYFKCQVDI